MNGDMSSVAKIIQQFFIQAGVSFTQCPSKRDPLHIIYKLNFIHI